MTTKKLAIGCLSMLLCLATYSQNEAQIWYFGDNVGLDFSTNPPSVISGMSGVDNSDNVLESAASISDGDGNFLFGTNGKDIYSADLQKRGTLPNGSNFSIVQGAQIIKGPGGGNTYYISTVPAGDNGCTSPAPSLTPVTVTGTSGNNITIGTPITLPQANVSGGQMILPKTNPSTGNVIDEYWIIYHELLTNNFHVYELTAGGVNFVKKESAGPNVTNCTGGGDVIAFMKSNGCYNQFAMSNNDKVNLFDFDTDDATITFTNSQTVTAAYGIEFSPSGKKVFVTTGLTGGDAVDLYSINVSPGGTGSNLGSPNRVGALWATQRGGAMQVGPDGKIYVGGMKNWGSYGSTEYMGVITDPDGSFSFDPKGVEIPAPGHMGMGVPLFPASLVASKVEINDTSVCEGNQANFRFNFTGTEQDTPDRLWQFFENATATGVPAQTFTSATASYTWSTAGSYAVTFQLKDICGRNKYDTVIVEINPFLEADATVDYSTCPTPTLNGIGANPSDPNGYTSYKWFDENPTLGGNLVGIGNSFQASANSTYWVVPAGNVVTTNANDTRSAQNYGSSSGNTTITVADGIAILSEVSIGVGTAWSSSPFNGDFTFTLKQGGSTKGTPVTVNETIAASSEVQVTVSVSDWVLTPGSYTIEINKPGWASARTLTSNNATVGSITYSGGMASSIKALHAVETDAINCVTPKSIDVGACCQRPNDNASIDPIASTVEVCEPLTGEVVSVSGLTDGLDFQWQESPDGINWTDIAGENGDVSGGQINLNAINTNQQWYRFLIAEDGKLSTCAKESDSIQFIQKPLPVIDSIGRTPYQIKYCKGTNYELEAQVNETSGYPVTYTWDIDANGTDSVFDGITTPGTHTYKVVANANGCLDSLELSVDVAPLDTAQVINLPSVCNSDNPINLQLDPDYVTSGSWTDSIGGNSYLSLTGEFNPQYGGGLPEGLVSVIFNTDGTCPGSDTANVVVTSNISYTMDHLKQDYCMNETQDTIKVSPGGGTFWTSSGLGIIDSDKGYWSPQSYVSAGVDTIWYGKSGDCGDTVFIEVTLNAVEEATITPPSSVCTGAPAFDFTVVGTPGGTWSGLGISDASQ
ncbi:MAG: hypothetical protein CMP61_00445, partial [Flavobacteriales bacterium]|nr:hypothetical protein [Flavobacteriales bacterium]